MLRYAGLVGLLALPSLALADVAVSPDKLIATPKAYIGELVVMRAIACVDPGGSGFVCEAQAGKRRLRIRASVLGALTELPIAERLIRACKGEVALRKPVCRVDITITPSGVEVPDASDPSGTPTIIHAPEIEMYPPRKVR